MYVKSYCKFVKKITKKIFNVKLQAIANIERGVYGFALK